MAMPPGNGAVSEKMQTQNGNGGTSSGGAEMFHHSQHRQWSPDERDGFISWLRGEFAAANAIIDSLCHHLRWVGEPGEYDGVLWSIQQRRSNWNPVLHMQPYVSVGDVVGALQQVTWLRQQQFFEPVKAPPKEFKRNNSGFRVKQRVEHAKESRHSNMDSGSSKETSTSNNLAHSQKGEFVKSGYKFELPEDKRGSDRNLQADGCIQKISLRTVSSESEHEVGNPDDRIISDSKGRHDVHIESNSQSIRNPQEKKKIIATPKNFVGTEILDGKEVNVVDGMKLYENFLDTSEVSRLVSLVNDLRAAGKRGKLQGVTFVISKRPMNGHGREIIQFGLPVADVPLEDENAMGTFPERRVESIPYCLQHVIEDLMGMQIMTVKPDSCVIDIFNEGDYSQPHMWPTWFGRPVYLLSLTESEVAFGKVFGTDLRGNYKGSLRLSLAPGSLLAMEGNSADFAKHAIPAVQKQRMLVTFTKSQPRKVTRDAPRHIPPSPSSHWGQSSSNSRSSSSSSHIRHSLPKHYTVVSTSAAGVLTAPPPAHHPFLPAPNGIQPPPLFVPAPAAVAVMPPASVTLPPPSSVGWPGPPPPPPPARHHHHQPLARPPLPGTGVFLPPGSEGKPAAAAGASTSFCAYVPARVTVSPPGSSTSSGASGPKGNSKDGNVSSLQEDCNGSMDETSGGEGSKKNEEEHILSSDGAAKEETT